MLHLEPRTWTRADSWSHAGTSPGQGRQSELAEPSSCHMRQPTREIPGQLVRRKNAVRLTSHQFAARTLADEVRDHECGADTVSTGDHA